MKRHAKHKAFCFAGQPAPVKGYFPNDVLPCICGIEGSVTGALAWLCLPAPILRMLLNSDASQPKARRAMAAQR